MRREVTNLKVLRIVPLLALLGTAGCAYQNPEVVSPAAPDTTTPSQLTLGVTGSTTDAGTSTVTARVQNTNGVAIGNVIVTFATTRGTISPAQTATRSDGIATAVLTTSDAANVTATAGGLTAHTLVVPAVPSTPTPPTPTRAAAFLNVLPSATTGVAQVFSVSSSATGVTWNWSFGDGNNEQTTSFATTHTYGRAGVYNASVSATGTSTGTAVITVTDPTPTAGPGAPTLSVTLTCTAGTRVPPAPPTATTCNTTQTFGSATIGGNAVNSVAWDWGDGTNRDNSTIQPVNTHTYANPGTFNIIATVTANTPDGVKTATASKNLIVP